MPSRSRSSSPCTDAFGDRLNDAQRRAVDFGRGGTSPPGPLLVIAGAGSGKTDTLAHRVARLVLDGADPQRLLLLTFSRRAAAEMERRTAAILARALGNAGAPFALGLPWSGTFHSVAARLLRVAAARVGLHESFTIHDRGDSEDLLAVVRHDAGLSATRNRFPTAATCLAIYSRSVNGTTPLGAVLTGSFPWCAHWEAELKALFRAYVAAKQAQNVLDFDDLLLYWDQMMAEPGLAAEVGARFDHVLIDEYQDTNRLQANILRALKPDGRGVTVVGDDAQSIYSFRAATVRNILDFPTWFTTAAEIVTLDRNYRSTQPILDASNAVIALASERFSKELWSDRKAAAKPQLVCVRDEADQARFVAERVLARRECGIALKAQAVLFRSSSHSAQLELELARRDIPFVKYGGLRFLEAAHVKDVLSLLRWAENPRCRTAGFRAARLLPGFGPATAARLLDAMEHAPDPLPAMAAFAAPRAAVAHWPLLLDLYRHLRQPAAAWPLDLDRVVDWYLPQLQRLYDDAPARQRDLAQLQQIAASYPSRERFLTEVTLDPPAATSDDAGPPGRDDDYLVLSTIHSAKGLEWHAVHVLNVVDGCIPSDMATGTREELDEERRLLYVAMTRARDELQLLVPQRFYVHAQPARGDRHVYAGRSRFITEAVARQFEPVTWPVAPSAATSPPERPAEPQRPLDLAARVRALWN